MRAEDMYEVPEEGPWGEVSTPGPEDAPAVDWISMGTGSEERFQGDMVLTEEQLRQLNVTDTERNGIIGDSYRWPNAQVPYTISNSFSNSERNVILAAMSDYQTRTCIAFVERTSQSNYVSIIKSSGCWSYVGRIGGAQQLSLGNGCVYNYIAQHELMHAVGFFHEQSRCDRNSYVTILAQNIQSGRENNFNYYSCSQVTHYGEPYDYVSVMHYSKYAFSKNGQPTIQAIDDPSRTLGNNQGLTQIDVNKLNAMYTCDGSTSGTAATTSATDSTSGTTLAGSCKDLFTGSYQCDYWANTLNYCSHATYGSYMMDYCRMSCNNCSPCEDHTSSCSSWEGAGYCDVPIYMMYMARRCPASCEYCQSSASADCDDMYSQCPGWASSGYCAQGHRYHTWMRFNCRNSCDSELGTCSTCEDYNTGTCETYERRGWCDRSITTSIGKYMATYCRKTCGDC